MTDTAELERQVATLSKELSDLRQALAEGKDIKTLQPVKVDTTYLCPKDPNRQKVLDQGGLVLIEDAPLHLNGWITKIENVTKKHQTFVDGRQIQFEQVHQVATWKCQHDGSEIVLDPYLK